VLSLSFLVWLCLVGRETEVRCLYGVRKRGGRMIGAERLVGWKQQVRVTACGHVLCGAVLTAYTLRGRIIDPRGFY
jgi:hypothetical protein